VGVTAAVLAVGGSVAALTVVPNHDGKPAPATIGSDTTTTATAVSVTLTTTTSIVAEPVTIPIATPAPPPVATEPPTSAAPATTAPTTATPTTMSASTTVVTATPTTPTEAPTVTTSATTEVHVPRTLSISCTPRFDAGRWIIRCEWSASTFGDLARYRLLRSVDGQSGRAFDVGGDTTAYIDTTVEHGVAYRYLVRAERADTTALETSTLVTVTWPADPPEPTTTSTATTRA
jgi:hypothetical protein